MVQFFFTRRSFLFFTPAGPQPSTSDLLPGETSVSLPSTQSEPFQPMNFQFPKTKVGKQNRSFNAKWFREYPWLHYVVQKDAVLCFLCAKQKSKLNSARNKELVFIQSGFSNWKNALAQFREHQNSNCHKLAVEYSTTIPSCGNVVEMMSETARATMEENRQCLITIIECLQFLARQGLAFQGNTEEESNFLQLLKLRAKDRPELLVWLNRTADKYTSHEIQNELIAIIASRVIQDLVSDIQKAIFFAIICDEYTDISNKEQLTICIRWVDDSLVAHEDFIGFIKIPNISAETIVKAIKDALAKLGLSLTNCRGQCYDGASNMLGPKTGVARRIQEVAPKAHPTHCYAHSLSLSVKDMTCNCQLLSLTMDIAKEIVTLIKFSPKRESLLQQLKENLETEDEDASSRGIIGLCPTRWTVRASCFRRILENYSVLMEEWDACLSERLQPDVRARIIGCKAQMERFDFFFGLHLGERLYSHTDNLSKTLQGTKMAAVSGQRLANLTKETLTKMRTDQSFDYFYANVARKSEGEGVGEPTLPRKRRTPARLEVGSGAPSYPTTAKDYFRRVYYEAIDLIVSAIDQRFNQESFSSYAQMETLLVKAANGEDYEAEFKFLEASYSEDVDTGALPGQLSTLEVMLKEEKTSCFDEILLAVSKFPEPEKKLIQEVQTVCKLLAVNPATSAAGERSFSSARRLKTWLRSRMGDERFSNLAMLNGHKRRTDSVSLTEVAQEFVSRNENRKRNFGTANSFKSITR